MQALLFQGKKLGICIQLYTEFIKCSPPRPSPSWGGNRRWNTQYFVRMRTGNDPKPSLKPKISIFAQSCGGNRFTFPTLQFFVTLNLIQGRKGVAYQLQSGDSEINSEWRLIFVTRQLNNLKTTPFPGSGREQALKYAVFRTNEDGERPQTILATLKSPFQRNLVKNPQILCSFINHFLQITVFRVICFRIFLCGFNFILNLNE